MKTNRSAYRESNKTYFVLIENKCRARGGLVLLVVLGMLALFSLLAISYLTLSSNSRNATASLTRAKLASPPIENLAEKVVRQMVSGTNDNRSAMYGHGLLEDIYGRDAIEGVFLPGSAALNRYAAPAGATILKIQLDPRIDINPDPFRATPAEATTFGSDWRQSLLSANSDTYTGRLITFLGGPLENQTYRILGYWGYPGPIVTGATPPEQIYLRFSIAIDLGETDQKTFRAVNANRRAAGTLQEWIDLGVTNGIGPNILIQDNTTTPPTAYPFVINDIPFNGFGYGLEGNSANPSFGNLDQGALIPDPLNLTGAGRASIPLFTIPLALLPNYDYLERNRSGAFDTGVLGNLGGVEVNGSSNEGFDVPDYHDFWMSFVPEGAIASTPASIQPPPTTAEIIPAFHRPELINYIVQTYSTAASSLNKYDLYRMVQLIDYACARPLSYHLQDPSAELPEIRRNLGFEGRLDGRGIPTLDIDVSNLPNSIREIQEWVGKLIGRGPVGDIVSWDVDNEGTGVADSVWVDPNLPLITSPDGRPLKVLAAPLVLDMDGRLNLNAIGDAIQGNAFAAPGTGTYHTRSQTGADSGLLRNGSFLPQGLGYGPAEISAAGFFSSGSVAARTTNYANLFNFRYGADAGSGNSTLGGAAFDDFISRYFKQRGLVNAPFGATPSIHRGLQQSRRGQIAYGIDRKGNPRMTDSPALAARTYFNANPSNPYPECLDDPYETSPNEISSNDTELTLAELESILRRYDRDSEALSTRLKKFVRTDLGHSSLTHAIYSAISTRSNELRYPNMAAIARHDRAYLNRYSPMINGATAVPNPTPNTLPTVPPFPAPSPYAIPVPPSGSPTRLITNGRNEGSFLRWVQLLHQERFPAPAPALEMADIRLLFPLEFRKALRLDLNRPFGNGIDEDGDGLIDEPEELSSAALSAASPPGEQEFFPRSATSVVGQYYPLAATEDFPVIAPELTIEVARYITPMRSRKLLARQLYCLAQLVIAADYPFGGVASGDPNYVNFRARELAQWAVNVVDFRDSDGAMTRFEYDSTPFSVDGGDVFPAGHPRAGSPMVWLPEVGNVVWGMEFPELLITETLAFHDKRLRDTSNDNDPSGTPASTTDTPPDEDFDQYRIPQGSLYIELYCPRSSEVATAANPEPSLGAAPTGQPTNNASTTYPTFLPSPTGRLYTLNGAGVPVLQLSATTPTDTVGTAPSTGTFGPQPVFRIGISHPIRPGSGEFPEVNPAVTLATGSFPARFTQTNQASMYGNVSPLATVNGYTTTGLINNLTAPAQIPTFDRMIWFTPTPGSAAAVLQVPDLEPPFDSTAPGMTNRGARIFYNSGAAVGLEPGRYMVIGPRTTTYIGSNVTSTPLLPLHEPSAQSIQLGPGTVTVSDLGGAFGAAGTPRAVPPNVLAPTTMIAISEPPTPAWLAGPFGTLNVNGGVGLNISEPLAIPGSYYPQPTYQLNSGDADGADGPTGPVPGFATLPQDAYHDLAATGNNFLDEPLDHTAATNPVLATTGFTRFQKGTHANERVAYLQRVADPELPYHPLYNPYITIDWMSLDLTVFNGEDDATDDPDNVGDYTMLAFQSRYKDGARVNEVSATPGVVASGGGPRPTGRGAAPATAAQTGVSIFSSSTAELRGNTPQPVGAAPGSPYFNYELGIEDPPLETATSYTSVTLGYLNHGRQFGPGVNDWDGFGLPQPNANPAYVGAPLNAQAGLFWFNRSFTNPNELMLVPRTAPGQFGDSMTTPKSGAAPPERYYTTAAVPTAALPSPYGYLPAFFSSVAAKIMQPPGVPPFAPYWQQSSTASSGANWNLMLELVETAPPFSDSERWVDPTWFATSGTTPIDYTRTYLLGGYRAPFNALPTYRTPGKVNVNTIARREVWDAVEWNYDQISRDQAASAGRSQSTGGPWEAVKVARRGYNINSNLGTFFDSHPSRATLINPFLDANVPTQFAGAFRPGFGTNVDVAAANLPSPPPRMVRSQRSVTSSLLRPETGYGFDPQQTAAGPTGPFSITPPPAPATAPVPPPSSTNMLVSPTPSALVNPEIAHQPFVNYQRAMRLPNLVTNQSNVFAVWVTIGLFEYDEVNGIGAEYVGPSGTPERTKSFYIIDRSVPVGFAPGKTFNSDKTILLRRKIPR